MFHANRTAALQALESFLPHAGKDYSRTRNFDFGPENRSNVSTLSPWIRTRLLPEWEVIRRVLEHHSLNNASKFIDEVCWRTYWKGWLQQRPVIWQDYLNDVENLLPEFLDQTLYLNALSGKSDIDCMDSWSQELIETGYLHNHARMWFASIWIHTLQLPWQLGADFFLRHLLDGDPASNTLSWRWVAGLHTRGKSYLARADNIEKYTQGRFSLANTPLASEAKFCDEEISLPEPVSPPACPAIPAGQRVGLLVADEDLASMQWIGQNHKVVAVAGLLPQEAYSRHRISEKVIHLRRHGLRSTLDEIQHAPLFEKTADLIAWAINEKLDGLILSEPMTGFWDAITPKLHQALADEDMSLYPIRHAWDELLHPHATVGFFKFKKQIPQATALATKGY
jgi:hypothetical protein